MSRSSSTCIAALEAFALDVPMRAAFTIAGGAQNQVNNVLVRVLLMDGTTGHGECAPLPAFNGETQARALRGVRWAGGALAGRDAARPLLLSGLLRERFPDQGSVRAGVEMAVLDAWARSRRMPLWAYFGGVGSRVATDVTIPIVTPEQAAAAARRIVRLGASTLKIKVGRDPEEDFLRVDAAVRSAPGLDLLLDANQGYGAGDALRLLRLLRRRGIRPLLFEQPLPKGDMEGMAEVARLGGVPVAADESVTTPGDVWRIRRHRAASVINVKLMKHGIIEALEVARAARAAGFGLMMGAMVESPLALACAAHFSAGLGGFRFIDLDTYLWFSNNPMSGPAMCRGGTYTLEAVRAGIGVRPSGRWKETCFRS